MCSNYLPVPREALREWNYALPDFAYAETYPGLVAPFLANAAADRWLPGTFGLMPHWAKPALYRSTYNARSETVGEKASFRAAWAKLQLCVIPVAAFYEPNYASGRPVRWRIERADGSPFGVAGIWERRHHGDAYAWSFSMLTVNADAHPLMRQFQKPGSEKRSVVILPDDAWRAWLDATDVAQAAGFLKEFDAATMRAEPAPQAPAKSAPPTLPLDLL
jgi:putative SOS response-associated peptidase YedK